MVSSWLRSLLAVDPTIRRAVARLGSRDPKRIAEATGYNVRTVQNRMRVLGLSFAEGSPGTKSMKGAEHLHEPYKLAA